MSFFCKKLKEENKTLKKENKELKKLYQRLNDTFFKYLVTCESISNLKLAEAYKLKHYPFILLNQIFKRELLEIICFNKIKSANRKIHLELSISNKKHSNIDNFLDTIFKTSELDIKTPKKYVAIDLKAIIDSLVAKTTTFFKSKNTLKQECFIEQFLAKEEI